MVSICFAIVTRSLNLFLLVVFILAVSALDTTRQDLNVYGQLHQSAADTEAHWEEANVKASLVMLLLSVVQGSKH